MLHRTSRRCPPARRAAVCFVVVVGHLALAAPPPARAGVERWTQVGPPGGTVRLVEVSPGRPRVIFAGLRHGLYRSTDGGRTWSVSHVGYLQGVPADNATAVAVSARDPNLVWAGTDFGAFLRSTDGGARWADVSFQWPLGPVAAVGIHPRDARIVYMATASGLFRTADGGSTWAAANGGLPGTAPELLDLEIDPASPSTLWALVRLPDGSSTVFRSTNDGRRWERRDAGLPADITALVLDARAAGRLLASGGERVWITTDRGRRWRPAGSAPAPEAVFDLQFVPAAPARLIARGAQHLLVSDDLGATWRRLDDPSAPRLPQALAFHPDLSGRLYAGTLGGGLLVSGDGGSHWAEFAGPGRAPVAGLAVHPALSGQLYAAPLTRSPEPNPYQRVLASAEGGSSWAPLPPLPDLPGGVRLAALTLAGAPPYPLYAAYGGAFYRSDDGGASWTGGATGYCGDIFQLLGAPSEPETVFLRFTPAYPCTGEPGFCESVRTRDGGASLECLDFLPLAVDPTSAEVLYASRSGRLARSEDGGLTWTELWAGALETGIVDLVIDRADPSHLFLATSRQIFESTDRGLTFADSTGDLSTFGIMDLTLDPTDGERLYVRQFAFIPPIHQPFFALHTSGDGGATWSSLLAGIGSDLGLGNLTVDPLHPQILYATNGTDGVLRYTLRVPQTCAPGATTLCLLGGRFRVEATWKDFAGRAGVGQALPLTADTGGFWFFDQANVELVAKVLDGGDLNGRFWFFYGALSSVEYRLEVTDCATGDVRTYFNPPGRLASRADTGAFEGDAAAEGLERDAAGAWGGGSAGLGAAPGVESARGAQARSGAQGQGSCTPSATALCLQGGRFRLEVEWRDFDGGTGVGQALPLTANTGTFWFFDEANLELVAKVHDGTPLNGRYWVFYGALSNVEYTLTVTDTSTGAVRTYHNPLGTFASAADTEAF